MVELTIFVIHQSEKAIWVEDLNGKKIWMPKANLEVDGDFESWQKNDITMPEWIAIKNELV